MNEDLEEHAALYVLGLLNAEETAPFEEELWSDVDLQLLVQELQDTTDALAQLPAQHEPPPELRERLFASIRGEKPAPTASPAQTNWVPWAVAAALAVHSGYLMMTHRQFDRENTTLTKQIADLQAAGNAREKNLASLQTTATDSQRQIADLTAKLQAKPAATPPPAPSGPDDQTKQELAALRDKEKSAEDELTTLKQRDADSQKIIADLREQDALSKLRIATLSSQVKGSPAIAGSVVWDGDKQRGLVTLEKLPPPGPAQDYQLWVMDPHYPQPISGGIVRVDSHGAAKLVFTVDVPIHDADKFAVSRERKGGSSTTPGPIVLLGH